MSAIVCGKRSFFEDLSAAASSSPPVSKKLRYFSSSSPSRYSPPTTVHPPSSAIFDHLFAIFPDMEKQVIERAIDDCGDDIDLAISRLNQLRLGSTNNTESVPEANNESGLGNDDVLQLDGNEWVELFVREMTNASDMNNAKERAARALEALEKSINARATKENLMLREQLEGLVKENSLLKRAVVTQQKRQRESDDQSQELMQLRQQVTQYQEQLRTLEVNNYALTLHLKQAQQSSSSIPGRYHPDVF